MNIIGLLLIVCPLTGLLGWYLGDASRWVRRVLGGRGEVDALDGDLRSRIDGDTPLPVAEATRVNREFAGLVNSDLRELRRVDEDLAQYYFIGDDK